jgi:squalene-hopene/tetraprenyl-beta-curcumene cyclase
VLWAIAVLIPILIMLLLLASFPVTYAVTPFEQRVNDSIEAGLEYLRDTQQPGGYWGSSARVADASLGILCFITQKDSLGNLKGYSGLAPSDQAIVDDALAYIVSQQKSDDSIWYDHETYETGLAMSALAEVMSTGGSDYTTLLTDAIDYFVAAQVDEGEGAAVGSTYYGGWNYEAEDYPGGDNSNTQFALIGLRAADSALGGGIVPSGVWSKAIVFEQHCQNDPAINNMAWAQVVSNPSHDDGGFVYIPNGWSLSDAGYYGSTGSHTALGAWNYLMCGLLQTDSRVDRALDWLKLNYDYDENPNEQNWPFYYYYAWAFSKAMRLTSPASNLIGGVRNPAADGYPEETPSWYYDFAWYLTETQHVDGTFYNNPNEAASWYPVIDTLFAILVLEGAVGIPMQDTLTVYTGDLAGTVGSTITLRAILTNKQTGDPIDNEPIVFTLQGRTATATTGPDGIATTTMTLDPPPGSYVVQASFPGDISQRLNPSSDEKPFLVRIIDQVIPEVPLGPVLASASMIIALTSYFAVPRWRRRRQQYHP